jgi:hypothetical protein
MSCTKLQSPPEPLTRWYRLQIPVLSVLCPQLNLFEPPPSQQNSSISHCLNQKERDVLWEWSMWVGGPIVNTRSLRPWIRERSVLCSRAGWDAVDRRLRRSLCAVFKGRLRCCGLWIDCYDGHCVPSTPSDVPPFKLLTLSDKWLWNCEVIPGVGRIVIPVASWKRLNVRVIKPERCVQSCIA